VHTPRIEISIGELLDKISILEIKQENITDSQKLSNIKKELDLLRDEASKFPQVLYLELKETNQKLWNIEDSIREKEYRKEFDLEFIELARSVYITNDLRSELKRKINLATNSSLIEEKSYTEK